MKNARKDFNRLMAKMTLQTTLKVVTSSNLNAFKGEVEAWCNKGYIPEWRSFKADIRDTKFIIFMVKLE